MLSCSSNFRYFPAGSCSIRSPESLICGLVVRWRP
jgi:hypothetical protein